MTTRTHTSTGLSKWEKVTMWSIGTFVLGLTFSLIADINKWPTLLQSLLQLAALAGFIMSFVSAPRVIGGLKTGIISMIAGAVTWFVGMTMKSIPEPSYIIGVEFAPFGDPLYIIGWQFVYYGATMFIVGAIMAAVTYLRRVLRAVEGRDQPHRVAR